MLRLIERAREKRAWPCPRMRARTTSTPSATKDEPFFPGNEEIERKFPQRDRWNAP